MTTSATQRQAFTEASRELAESLGQLPERIGDSWYFTPATDKGEDKHRVDLLAGDYYCTCRGFIHWRHCRHVDKVREMNESDVTHELTVLDRPVGLALTRHDPQTLAIRLADMKMNRTLTQQFFKEVMQEGVDYGVIPGTEKPTLYKPGAEGLLEFYGFAPTIKHVQETVDYETGFLRNVVTIALVQRGSGEVVAEGIGECNTREARYFYRWVPEWKMPPMSAEEKASLKWEERGKKNGPKYKFYRLENEDLFTLWNTVKKMAKKRALVDATLSATRSSGLFSQGQEALEDWIEAEYEDVTDRPETEPVQAPPAPPTPAPASPAPQDSGNGPVALLGAIEQAHGLGAKQAAIKLMSRHYGTTAVTKLDDDQRADYCRLLTYRLNDKGHEHQGAYTAGGDPVCRLCGEDVAAPAPAEAVAQVGLPA